MVPRDTHGKRDAEYENLLEISPKANVILVTKESYETASASIGDGSDCDDDASSTKVRECMMTGKPLDRLCPKAVIDYITAHNIIVRKL